MMLNAKNFGLAAGIFWGAAMFLMTWVSIFTGYGNLWLALMADVYPGYDITAVGSVVGLVYGFLDGFVGFFVFAWIYNKLNG